MKIAVCVKEVPDPGPNRRIDPGTKRMDRSGDRSLNQYDLQRGRGGAAPEGGRATARSSWSPWAASRALESIRKGLGMGADRAVLVSTTPPPARTSWPPATVLAAALKAESPDLVLFGQQATDGDGAVLWAAVADTLRMPVVSQISELEVAGGQATASARPSSATTPSARRCRPCSRCRLAQRAALPVPQGDHGREEEAPGGQEPGRRRRGRRRRGRGGLPHHGRRRSPAALARGHHQDRGRRQRPPRRSSTSSWKGSSYEHARLPGAPRLVDPDAARSACSPRPPSSTRRSRAS